MISKRYIWWIFVLMVLAQLYVPAQMIWSSENTISKGEVFKFKTVPVDPFDPFRGKYIRLRYEEENVKHPIDSNLKVDKNQTVYAEVEIIDDYAHIAKLWLGPPKNGMPYIKVKTTAKGSGTAYIDLPFDEFFMEESLAKPAEDLVRAIRQDSTSVVYAKISILEGNAVLEDVMINEVPIADYVRSEISNQ